MPSISYIYLCRTKIYPILRIQIFYPKSKDYYNGKKKLVPKHMQLHWVSEDPRSLLDNPCAHCLLKYVKYTKEKDIKKQRKKSMPRIYFVHSQHSSTGIAIQTCETAEYHSSCAHVPKIPEQDMTHSQLREHSKMLILGCSFDNLCVSTREPKIAITLPLLPILRLLLFRSQPQGPSHPLYSHSNSKPCDLSLFPILKSHMKPP